MVSRKPHEMLLEMVRHTHELVTRPPFRILSSVRFAEVPENA